MTKSNWFWAIIVFLIIFLVFSNILNNPNKKQNENNVIKEFYDNKSRFIEVLNFLKNVQGDVFIGTRNNDFTLMYFDGKRFQPNKLIATDIRYILFKLKFKSIGKDSKKVRFIRASKFGDFEQGVVYSFVKQRPEIYKLKELKNIDKNLYYYYRSESQTH